MSQQMVNGSFYQGSVTVTNRMSDRYAVVNPPFSGLHLKPQDEESLRRRKEHWRVRNASLEETRKERQKRKEKRHETVHPIR